MVRHPRHYLTVSAQALREARSGTNGDVPKANPLRKEKNNCVGAGSEGGDPEEMPSALGWSAGQGLRSRSREDLVGPVH